MNAPKTSKKPYQETFWLTRKWQNIEETQQFALVLAIFAVMVIVAGYITVNGMVLDIVTISDAFYANLGAEALSIIVTVLILDRLNETRAKVQRQIEKKAELIAELGGSSNDGVLRALRLIKHYEYDKDGSLRGANLQLANLRHANLRYVNMPEVRLDEARLDKADLIAANLSLAVLEGACLRNCKLVGANLSGADLTNSDLAYAELGYLVEEKGNPQRNYVRVRLSSDTLLPNGMRWNEDIDLRMFTDPDHPEFWQPDWVETEQQA